MTTRRFKAQPTLRDPLQVERQFRAIEASLHAFASRAVTGSATLTPEDDTILADTSGGNITLTLPPIADMLDRCFTVKKMAAANTLTVAADGSDTIDGAATLAWDALYQSYVLQATSDGWMIVAAYATATDAVPVATVRLTADGSAQASAALANVTGLALPVAASTTYAFEFYVIVATTGAAFGYRLALTCPSGATLTAQAFVPMTGDSADCMYESLLTSSGDQLLTTTLAGTTQVARVSGLLITGANAGTLQYQHALSTTGGGIAVTPKAGSCGILTAIT